ncbi:hypothetical protein D3C80_1152780 [compost metagenome]
MLGNVASKALGVFFNRPIFRSMIAVRDDAFKDMRRATLATFALILIRAEIDEFLCCPMIGPIEHDRFITTGVIARHSQRQAVCFATRASK